MLNGIGADLPNTDGPTYSPNIPFGVDNTPQVFTEYLIPIPNAPTTSEQSFLEKMLSTSLPGPFNPLVGTPTQVAQPTVATPYVEAEEKKTNWMLYAAIAIGAVVAVKALGRKK